MEGIVVNKKKSYKNPVFLFTSCSLRFAAWAGWYSAFGEEEQTEKFVHQAHTEWAKEIELLEGSIFLIGTTTICGNIFQRRQ